jgi:MFS family permease
LSTRRVSANVSVSAPDRKWYAQVELAFVAVHAFGIPIGSALGLFFGGVIASTVSWRAAFFILGLGGLALAPLMLATVREPVRGGLDLHRSAARFRARFGSSACRAESKFFQSRTSGSEHPAL